MDKNRLEAFSDGVLAIIITIMVLEIKAPHGGEFSDLLPLIPVVLSYILSFIYIGIYWNNHHHLFKLADRINGRVMWANMHVLFWLSLIPFVTSWLGENHFASAPIAVYGVALIMPAFAWWIMVRVLLSVHSKESRLRQALQTTFKEKISLVLYAVGIALSFVAPWGSALMYFAVSLLWLIPDKRMEKFISEK